MIIKSIRIYSLVGMNLGGLTCLVCIFYVEFLMKYIDIGFIMSVLALIASIQAVLASLIYKKIKEYFPGDQLSNKERVQ